jgi:hypothetical protein
MRPKLQKQSALKLAGRIIPEAKRSGIRNPSFNDIQISKAEGRRPVVTPIHINNVSLKNLYGGR